MKKVLLFLALMAALLSGCETADPAKRQDESHGSDPSDTAVDNGITYQLLVYSFCDSDGDGCGDFKGIESKLDYIKALGASAIWLSPIHPAYSYHGYDVLDYYSVNPDYGTEEDFKSLVAAAHAKGIKIYLDYVLNHCSKDHPWFLDAKSSKDSPYRDFFIFSDDPKADIQAGKIAMIEKGGYDSGQWYSAVSGESGAQKVRFTLTMNGSKPSTLKVSKTEDVTNSGTAVDVWLYYGDGKMVQFFQKDGVYSAALDLETSWGVLVRTSKTTWDGGTKFGAPAGKNKLSWDTPLSLSTSDAQDILMPEMTSTMYHSHMWTSYFADFNYGAASTCETSGAFKALTESADKWIWLGVDGFRLDAIKHIYHNASSDENPTFLKKFYDHCNAAYKAAGHNDDIYMVGEHFSEASEVAPYYKGLPAFFEFSFWWKLKDALNSGNASSFASDISAFRSAYETYRSEPIAAIKLTNHDEDRASSSLSRNTDKLKLAAAVLMTFSGEPYIYQGEELGYWGVKTNGDEYVRTPIMWDSSSQGIASAKLGGKVDYSMLSASISVESQEKDSESLLSRYRALASLRSSHPALAKGTLTPQTYSSAPSSVAAWFREYNGEKILVIHNFTGNASFVVPSDKLDNPIAEFGNISVRDSRITLGPRSTAVFLQ